MTAQIVSFHCVLKDKLGKVISSTFNQDVMSSLQEGPEFLKGLSIGLDGIKKGEKRNILVPAEHAYGFYDPALVLTVPRKQIVRGEELKVGDEFFSRYQSAVARNYRVTQVSKKMLTLDGNHPLAGKDLVFDIEATEARPATRAEIEDSRLDLSFNSHLH